ncbi:hypothetical protein BD289DRAFT_430690 [Coniella lustricola]|uniref:Uncharacterized protein n=1 Tax=Coniella lustricola TaxID=2025994 RepID=A0A2T3ABI7_9PEZI|nr:hypothetical protein BD289DRAFT_430690 [Coniella lustricola]
MAQPDRDQAGDSKPSKTTSGPTDTQAEDVPPFTSPFAAIFIPLTDALLEPIEPILDPVERLQKERANLDANEKAVRSNLAFMFEREARRRIAEAKKTQLLSTPHTPQELGSAELSNLVDSLAAPAMPGMTYHLPSDTLARIKRSAAGPPPENPANQVSPHEHTLREVLNVTQIGVDQIEKYSELHVKTIRENLNKRIEKAEREK